MKTIFFTLVLLLSINNSFAARLIVSDVDDTIKVTDVLSKSKIIFNGLFSKKAFSGMSDLYQEMSQDNSTVFYVSGSPALIKDIVAGFLDVNKFPQKENLILKSGSVSTYDYKVAAIRNLIAKYKPESIVLVGDDTEFDPEVYNTISSEYPGLVEGIYIRAVKNRQLPDNILIKNFFAASEIAGAEFLKGHLNVSSLETVVQSFINQTNNSRLAIKGRYCPVDGRSQIEELKQKMTDQMAIELLERTQAKIVETCSK